MSPWPKTTVVGPGGVGAYFGGMLARAGAPVTMLGRPGPPSAHLKRLGEQGLHMQTTSFEETVPVTASNDAASIANSELVLFCVKTVDTESAAAQIAPHLAPGAILVDMQNGVDNPDKLRAAGIAPITSVVYVAAALNGPGKVIHRGRGDLVVGHKERAGDVERLRAWFEAAEVPCKVSPTVETELWLKLIINSVANASSALTDATYGVIVEDAPTWAVAEDAAREAVAVARAEGHDLDEQQTLDSLLAVCRSVGAATSSTQQDLVAGRPTEIDSLTGYIARRGEELGVPTPINRAMWHLTRLRSDTIRSQS